MSFKTSQGELIIDASIFSKRRIQFQNLEQKFGLQTKGYREENCFLALYL